MDLPREQIGQALGRLLHSGPVPVHQRGHSGAGSDDCDAAVDGLTDKNWCGYGRGSRHALACSYDPTHSARLCQLALDVCDLSFGQAFVFAYALDEAGREVGQNHLPGCAQVQRVPSADLDDVSQVAWSLEHVGAYAIWHVEDTERDRFAGLPDEVKQRRSYEILATKLPPGQHSKLQHSGSKDIAFGRSLLVKESRVKQQPQAAENGAARKLRRRNDFSRGLRTRIDIEASENLDLRHR
jgi:hypothetical protein